MFETILTIASVIGGIAFVIAVFALDSAPDSVAGLFVFPTMPARPRGVQEMDLPPFVFRGSTTAGTGAA